MKASGCCLGGKDLTLRLPAADAAAAANANSLEQKATVNDKYDTETDEAT